MAERPVGLAEQPARWSIVEEDRVPVGHVELHPAQRIARPGALHHADIAIGPLGGLVSLGTGPRRIGEHASAKIFALHDRLRNGPVRIEDHALDAFRELRRRGAARLAHDRAIGAHDLVVHRQAKLIFGHVGDQVLVAQIARQPAPAIHVGLDQLVPLATWLGLGQFAAQRFVIGVQRSHTLDRGHDIARLERLLEHRPAAIAIGVRVHHEPLGAIIHRRAAVAHVFHQPHEPAAGFFIQHRAGAGGDRRTQAGKIVVCRDQAMRADPLDRGDKRLRLRHVPLLHHRIELLDHRLAGHLDRTGLGCRRDAAGGHRIIGIPVTDLLRRIVFVLRARQQVGRRILRDQRGRPGERGGGEDKQRSGKRFHVVG